MLKKIVMGTALAALIAVPTFATQSYASEATPGQDAQAHWTNAATGAAGAYAYAPAETSNATRVYVNGRYAGQDPDQNVRLQLQMQQRNPLSY